MWCIFREMYQGHCKGPNKQIEFKKESNALFIKVSLDLYPHFKKNEGCHPCLGEKLWLYFLHQKLSASEKKLTRFIFTSPNSFPGRYTFGFVFDGPRCKNQQYRRATFRTDLQRAFNVTIGRDTVRNRSQFRQSTNTPMFNSLQRPSSCKSRLVSTISEME